MTYKERYALDHPGVNVEYVANQKCPGDFYDGGYKNATAQCWATNSCSDCWDSEIPGTESLIAAKFPEEKKDDKPEKQPSKLIAQITPKIDISKLIDEAMEKKDRYVTVFVNNEGHMSINVYPYENNGARWIPVTYSDLDEIRGYKCSECGYEDQYAHHPYCAMCGEKLKRANAE